MNGKTSELIGGDAYYLKKMRSILEGFPNRGPPFNSTKLLPHLFIGSMRNADDVIMLQRLGITHVLNCAGTRKFDLRKSPYSKDSGITNYLMIPAEDHDDYDMTKHFADAISFIDRAKRNNGKVLVHCNLGVNRSGCIAAAYLMYEERHCLLEVIYFLKVKRAVVLYNKSFRRQLVRYARARGLLDVVEPEMNGETKNSVSSSMKSLYTNGVDSGPASVPIYINGVALGQNNEDSHFNSRRTARIDDTESRSRLRPDAGPVSSLSFTRSNSPAELEPRVQRKARRAHTAPLPSLVRPLQLSASTSDKKHMPRPASMTYVNDIMEAKDKSRDWDMAEAEYSRYPSKLGTLYEDFEELSLNPRRMFDPPKPSHSRMSPVAKLLHKSSSQILFSNKFFDKSNARSSSSRRVTERSNSVPVSLSKLLDRSSSKGDLKSLSVTELLKGKNRSTSAFKSKDTDSFYSGTSYDSFNARPSGYHTLPSRPTYSKSSHRRTRSSGTDWRSLSEY